MGGAYAVKHGKLLDLSEQELVDCDMRDNGCGGGLMENAYKTLIEIGGLEAEADYGYDGADEKCKFNRSKVAVRVSGGVELPQNETQMAQWLTKNGPIAVGLNAFWMQFYMGGVSHPPFFCDASGIDHGVLIGVWSPHHQVPQESSTLLDHQELLGLILGREWILQTVQRSRSLWYQHGSKLCYCGGVNYDNINNNYNFNHFYNNYIHDNNFYNNYVHYNNFYNFNNNY